MALLLLNFSGACMSKAGVQASRNSNRVSPGRPVEHYYKEYPVGDLDNNKVQDTAIIVYDMFYDPEECVDPLCKVEIRFTGTIPSFTMNMSMGVYAVKTEDINNDGANELLLFSRTWEGMWNRVYVDSYRNKKWETLAQGNTFGIDDEDFKNRVIKKGTNEYVLVIDEYNAETTDYERKEIVIRTK
jgi:hypothetical protein